MFADPQTLTADAPIGAKALVKINQDGYSSEYLLKESTGEYRLKIRNSVNSTKRDNVMTVERHNVEFTYWRYPDVTYVNGLRYKAYLVIENEVGSDPVVANDLAEALINWCTEANIVKLLAFES